MTLANRTKMAKRLIEEGKKGFEKHPHVIEFRASLAELKAVKKKR